MGQSSRRLDMQILFLKIKMQQCSFLLACTTLMVVFPFAKTQFAFPDARQNAFVQTLPAYQVIVPRKVSVDGSFVSHHLPHHYSLQRRKKRSLNDQDDVVHYHVSLNSETHHVELTPNPAPWGPGLVIERRKWNPHLNRTESHLTRPKDQQCNFKGRIRGRDDSTAALSTCHGLTGYLRLGSEEFLIEPVKGHLAVANSGNESHPHVIYKRSAIPALNEAGICGNENSMREAFLEREIWEANHQFQSNYSQPTRRRAKRSVSLERNVETLIVADQKMTEYYADEDIETYILTVVNMVANLYHDASIGNAFNIVVVRILLLENEAIEDGLDISHHADNTLRSFCKWQNTINPEDEKHPNHHDTAVLLTRYNICTRMNEPCSTLGLAEMGGMCQKERSCSVNEDTGLSLAYTIAHELGHNLGASHDGPHNGCDALGEKQQHVMAPQLSADAGVFVWSPCSQRDITRFLDRNWGKCLNDKPTDHMYSFPELPPGAMYNVDHQCRLQHGPEATICGGMDDICQTLWCRIPDNRCVSRLEPAASGTSCGKHKWCLGGHCVPMGDRPAPINGEWGEWGPWSDCTRTCGAGVSMTERHCDNPAPAHGGRYCTGERRKYRVCNIETCPEGLPSFRATQCTSYNYKLEKDKGENNTWLPVQIMSAPCQLHCKPSDGEYLSVMVNDTVIDGTACNPGTRDMCISGICRKVACDWAIDSKAQEDACGVCHGNGSLCKTIRGTYSELEGNEYVEMVTVPKGAKSVKIKELGSAMNYIAVRSNRSGEFYLNGHWTVQWIGEYQVGGSILLYRREGEMENIYIEGPLQESLTFLLLFRTTNPGVSYEYTVPNGNITRTLEYSWTHTEWSACTATCGGGMQILQAVCHEKGSGPVEDSYCERASKPDDKSQLCNTQACPPRWWPGPWQHCSVTCGHKGSRRRNVLCMRSLNDGTQMALDDADCNGMPKPEEEEPCPKMHPCPGDIQWSTGPWEKCGDDPCEMQNRTVYCSEPQGCLESRKPIEIRQCGNIVCGNWSVGNWSECSSTCGEGVQFRRVHCDGGLKCRDTIEPESIRKCRRALCEGSVKVESNRIEDLSPFDIQIPYPRNADLSVKEIRPNYAIEDKIDPDSIKVVEMQEIMMPAPGDLLADEAYDPNAKKGDLVKMQKMSMHIGEDAINLLNEIHNLHSNSLDVSKIKPTFYWKYGEWKECPVRCGGGVKARDSMCYEKVTATLVDDDLCNRDELEDVKNCNTEPCLDWKLSDWSECSATCGEGVRRRIVSCPVDDMCNIDSKPSEVLQCSVKPCVDWVSGTWGTCTITCGIGNQVRTVHCMDLRTNATSQGCALEYRPKSRQSCRREPCPALTPVQTSARNFAPDNRQNQDTRRDSSGSEKLRSCHDKLEGKLCHSYKHMCGTWYFKVKCCRTCKGHPMPPNSFADSKVLAKGR